jgi:class 3 adenylate cyclase
VVVGYVDPRRFCQGVAACVGAAVLTGGLFLQAELEAWTGHEMDVLIVISALVVTALFQQTERWLLAVVDRRPPAQRALTLLFTDIVGSTEMLVELGDERWHAVLREYRAAVRRHLKHFSGHEVDTAGDGFFATFDSPLQAVLCARAIAADMPRLGLRARIGLHRGSCCLGSEKISGLNVHAAARVMAMASPGEVLLSDSLRAALVGTDIPLEPRGAHVLKGVPGEWPLYAIA